MLIVTNHIYIYLIAVLVISAIAMVVYNRLAFYKEKRVTRKVQRLNAQLTLIMDANKTDAWTYNTKKNQFKVISKENLTETFYTPFEFSQLYDREDFKMVVKAIENIQNREQIAETLTVKGAPAEDDPRRPPAPRHYALRTAGRGQEGTGRRLRQLSAGRGQPDGQEAGASRPALHLPHHQTAVDEQ